MGKCLNIALLIVIGLQLIGPKLIVNPSGYWNYVLGVYVYPNTFYDKCSVSAKQLKFIPF